MAVRLHVKICEAKNLLKFDLDSSSPYVTLKLMSQDDKDVKKTKVYENNLNPVINEEFDIVSVDLNDVLLINMYDRDIKFDSKMINELEFPVDTWPVGGPIDRKEIDLNLKWKKAGKLIFEVQAFPAEGYESVVIPKRAVKHDTNGCRVHIKAFDAKNVLKLDLLSKADPYLRFGFRGKKETRVETETIYNTRNPIWNQEFDIVSNNRKYDILVVEMLDENFNIDDYKMMDRITILLRDHKIGEHYVFNDNIMLGRKNAGKLHFELDFLPLDGTPVKQAVQPGENEELNRKSSEKEDENQNLKKEILNLKEINSKFAEENSKLKAQSKANDDRLKKLAEENSELKARNKEYESRLKKIDSGIDFETSEPQVREQDLEKVFIDSEDEEFHEVVGKIGEGATSEVYKVIDTRSGCAMCKKILKDAGDQNYKNVRNSMKEIEVLLRIRHPCVCKAIGCNMQEKVETTNVDDEGKKHTTIALFFEFLPYSLRRLIDDQQLCSTMKTRIAVEVAIGMSHIHSLGLMHRDLKVENVMLNGVMEAKLIDFGLVHVQEMSNTLTRGVGTLAYMSPEMAREEKYDNKTDVYSYGVFLIVLFTGQIPHQKLADKLANVRMTLPSPSKKMSEYCIKLVKRCTSPKSKKRPTFDEIIDDMLNNKFSLAPDVDYELVFRRYRELSRFKELHK